MSFERYVLSSILHDSLSSIDHYFPLFCHSLSYFVLIYNIVFLYFISIRFEMKTLRMMLSYSDIMAISFATFKIAKVFFNLLHGGKFKEAERTVM